MLTSPPAARQSHPTQFQQLKEATSFQKRNFSRRDTIIFYKTPKTQQYVLAESKGFGLDYTT